MLISCLCPTFNRLPNSIRLIEEAVESFLQQTYPNKELILCNDQPLQQLDFNHPQVKVINCAQRFPTFARKIDYMITQAQGDYLCRWDDDDINLPHRLEYSFHHKQPSAREWRCENYIYYPKGGFPVVDYSHGNTHLTSIWHRSLLHEINGGLYPWQWAGGEDQKFNQLMQQAGYHHKGHMIPDDDIYYIYRWGVGKHWSGPGGDLQAVYDERGFDPVVQGTYPITPKWYEHYKDLVLTAIRNTDAQKRATYAVKSNVQSAVL